MLWFECQVRYGVAIPGRWAVTALVTEVCERPADSVAAVQVLVRSKLEQLPNFSPGSVIFLNTHEIPTPSWAKGP